MSAIESSLMFFSLIFLLMMNNRTKSFFFIMIFIWYRINYSFSLLSIEPYVYTCTYCNMLAAYIMSFQFSLPFTIINTHRAYSTLNDIRNYYLEENLLRAYVTDCLCQLCSLWLRSVWKPCHCHLNHLNLRLLALPSSVHQVVDHLIQLLPFLSVVTQSNLILL